MKEVPLFNRNGHIVDYAIVDDADFANVSQCRWFRVKSSKTYYAQSSLYFEGKQKTIQMHRFLLLPKCDGKIIDHADRNGLNNQRENLRITEPLWNAKNRAGCINTTSKYKGVSLVTYRSKQVNADGTVRGYEYKRWRAMININGKNVGLNSFSTEEEAAKVHDFYARKYHGEFAYLNFPNENITPKMIRRKSCGLANI